ncbi:hypothetical protein FN846DRAFT_906109 [Sphaerosporella brunnea]|uniref:Uncharacterized protein n=1 Tax=Sphaerosporella brunnea TaxID=1250544 RepID=A0A5J5EZ59_9PEZI|nr:hypothetical protein FN846DRAFT_906109 [Sphaerosporella brunnea]
MNYWEHCSEQASQPADNTVQVAAKRCRLNGRSRRKAAIAKAKMDSANATEAAATTTEQGQ